MIFVVGIKIPEAFNNYFNSIGDHSNGDCGKTVGLAWPICSVCSIVPFLGFLAAIGALVCMIIFIVKLWGMSGKIGMKPV